MFNHPDLCRLFLGYLAELPDRHQVRVHGYALMPNHYHLLLQTGDGACLSDAMQWLVGRFVQHTNARRGWDGAIFKGRFSNRVVEQEAYWRHLLAYVHLNPVRAGLLSDPGDAWWTSHGAYTGRSAPPFLTTDELLDLHGGVPGYLDYVARVREGWRGPNCFDPRHPFEPSEVAALRTEARCMAGAGHSIRAIATKIGRSRAFVEASIR